MARVSLAVSLWSLLLASLLPSILVPAVFRLSLWISEIVQGVSLWGCIGEGVR